MKSITQKIFCTALLLICFSCSQAPVVKKEVSQRSFLWSVNNAKDTLWLLGSIHLGREELYPLAPNIEKAFAISQELAVEMNIEEDNTAHEVNLLLQKQGVFPPDSNAAMVLDAQTLEKVDSICESWGLPVGYMHQFRPWLMAVQLSALGVETLGLDPHWGIDVHFMRRAQQRDMPVLALESAKSQVEVFKDLDQDEEIEYLQQTLLELDDLENQVDSMLCFWRSGDTLGMEKFVLNSIDSVGDNLKNKIYTQRNIKMAQQISRWIKEKRKVFVVVGAAHFVGPQSILHYLRKENLEVKQH
ncbi:MAG: TraB/GumN family protein [Fibrobacter sp.]|nr:TraB/GumN family protein [Fibrobacter sp.]